MAKVITKMFGGGKKGEVPSPQQAIQKLKETEEMLNKKSEYLEAKIEKELQAAKRHGLKNKKGIMHYIYIYFACVKFLRILAAFAATFILY